MRSPLLKCEFSRVEPSVSGNNTKYEIDIYEDLVLGDDTFFQTALKVV